MSQYLLHGKFTAKQGAKVTLSNILIAASQLVATTKGCKLYIIGFDQGENEDVFITEIWDNKEDHDNSLKVEGVRELIMQAMPLLDGQPTKGQEINILGGFGL